MTSSPTKACTECGSTNPLLRSGSGWLCPTHYFRVIPQEPNRPVSDDGMLG